MPRCCLHDFLIHFLRHFSTHFLRYLLLYIMMHHLHLSHPKAFHSAFRKAFHKAFLRHSPSTPTHSPSYINISWGWSSHVPSGRICTLWNHKVHIRHDGIFDDFQICDFTKLPSEIDDNILTWRCEWTHFRTIGNDRSRWYECAHIGTIRNDVSRGCGSTHFGTIRNDRSRWYKR